MVCCLSGRDTNSATQRLTLSPCFTEHQVQSNLQTPCTDFSCLQVFSISRRECQKQSQHSRLKTSWLCSESTFGVISAQPGRILLEIFPFPPQPLPVPLPARLQPRLRDTSRESARDRLRGTGFSLGAPCLGTLSEALTPAELQKGT